MVVRCCKCRKVVIAPDPERALDPFLLNVYDMFDRTCECGNVKFDQDLKVITADGAAEVWHPPEEQWVRYVPYTA